MADAKQVQIRRDTDANLMATTPAQGELGYNLTTRRLHLGDGATQGGTLTPNSFDAQQQAFNFGVAAGTSNALTLTLNPAPPSYAQPLTIFFRASSNNSASATINVNGLGARELRKIQGGALVPLVGGDIINGILYQASYNGTYFQVMNLNDTGLTLVSQGDLNTSTGTFSAIANNGVGAYTSAGSIWSALSSSITLPGGQYGFTPESRRDSGAINGFYGWFIGNEGTSLSCNAVPIFINPYGSANNSQPSYGQQRYIASSPPFDLGDGEVGGFIFALVNKTGDVVSSYAADVPPWAYNGPTNIRCTHKCKITGKKYRAVSSVRSLQDVMDGVPITHSHEEITHDIKNADMGLIPHPFGTIPKGHKVVLLDPMSDKIRRLIDYQNAGGDDVLKSLKEGYITIDNETVKRKCHKSVKVCKFKFRKTI